MTTIESIQRDWIELYWVKRSDGILLGPYTPDDDLDLDPSAGDRVIGIPFAPAGEPRERDPRAWSV